MNKHTTHTARSSYWATHRYIHLRVPWTRKLHSKWKLQSSLPILLFFLCLHKAVHPLCEAFLTWPILKLDGFFLKFKLITLQKKKKIRVTFISVYIPHFLESVGFSFTSTSHALVGFLQLLPLPPLHRSIHLPWAYSCNCHISVYSAYLTSEIPSSFKDLVTIWWCHCSH